ncbi:hypothetical protein ACGF13_00535 [Kitasatospora sp. NPDC048286]|uniref:hypothetical protein n=1 Tax=Kitasatospora sp. NPDC048286 TaxID=3364047 RepID=UPI003722D71D
MANCASCGATSQEGAVVCGSCGRPSAPPPPPPPADAPPAAPPVPPSYGPPPGAPGYPPPPPVAGPPAVGSWGGGNPYEPQRGPSPVMRWLTGSDWRPALRAAIAPTGVLLVAALITAVPSGYDYDAFIASPGYGDRFGAALAMTLNAFGAPFRLTGHPASSRDTLDDLELAFRVLPMTVTVLWALALWLGLRAGARGRKAVGAQLTRGQAGGEALRTAVVLAGVTLLIGLVGGTTWQPADRFDDESGYPLRSTGMSFGADSGWLEAVGWTALLAAALAFAVHGTDALRWAAWRNRSVRGWAVAALTAGQALALAVGLAALVAFVLVAANSKEGVETAVSLAFLPNLGLLLLGFGSGSTWRVHSGLSGQGESWGDRSSDAEISFFDLHDAAADWRWCGLLALAAAGLLGWSAYRRRLDAADRLRLAAVYGVALTVLMTVAGAQMTRTMSMRGWTSSARVDMSQETAVGLVFLSVLLANLVWSVVGAVLVPPLLAAVRGRGVGAPQTAVPYAESPFASAQGVGAQGAGVQGAGARAGGPYAEVPPQVPYATPGAPVVPGHGVPPQSGGPSEVLDSHPAPPAPAGGTSAPGAVPPPPGQEPVDPSVWREHP